MLSLMIDTYNLKQVFDISIQNGTILGPTVSAISAVRAPANDVNRM